MYAQPGCIEIFRKLCPVGHPVLKFPILNRGEEK